MYLWGATGSCNPYLYLSFFMMLIISDSVVTENMELRHRETSWGFCLEL